MGSEGAGYANEDGNLMGWINELCYVRLDLNPLAPTDPWTKGAHTGMSHLYLGQRGVMKLVQKAMTVPEKQERVREIYETVGVYLGYALAQYSEFYSIDHVMILGRVSKGAGGDLMLDTAKKVLETEFPEYAHIQFHTADDQFKAVGQCIAAAALPSIGSEPKMVKSGSLLQGWAKKCSICAP